MISRSGFIALAFSLISSGAGAFSYFSDMGPAPTLASFEDQCITLHTPDTSFTYTAGTTLANRYVVGATFSVDCNDNLNAQAILSSHVVNTLPTCTAGSPGVLNATGTVATIDAFGSMTMTPALVSTQCAGMCVSSAPLANYTCAAFKNPTEIWAVGVGVHAQCTGQGITKTGQTCNAPGADLAAVNATPDKPYGWVSVVEEPAPPSTGGGMTINKAVDITSICLDANSNGIDDVTGVTCAVLAAAALKTVRDGKVAEMATIGQSADLASEVGALSNQNGSWFNIPQKLLDVLSPPTACALEYVMPNLALMPTSTITFTGWCAVYTVVEPYFAFLMWLTTVLVLMSLWRKV